MNQANILDKVVLGIYLIVPACDTERVVADSVGVAVAVADLVANELAISVGSIKTGLSVSCAPPFLGLALPALVVELVSDLVGCDGY